MQLLRGIDGSGICRGGYVSIGNFDGVHRGHQRMIAALVERARQRDVPTVVLTFDPHPIELLAPDRMPPRLSTLEYKADLLAACGVDVLIAWPTSHELLRLTPDEFFEQIIVRGLNTLGLVEGPNFCFGRDRAGTVDTLRDLCHSSGMTLDVVEAVTWNGQVVSSSAVRSALLQGAMNAASQMLGRPYRVAGVVASGAGRGRALAFPTANLTGIKTLLPADGVYAGRVVIDGQPYQAAVHLGSNPTFDESRHKVEVHVLNFSGDLYQASLTVDLIDRIRGTMSFSNAQALQHQISADLEAVRRLVPLEPPEV